MCVGLEQDNRLITIESPTVGIVPSLLLQGLRKQSLEGRYDHYWSFSDRISS